MRSFQRELVVDVKPDRELGEGHDDQVGPAIAAEVGELDMLRLQLSMVRAAGDLTVDAAIVPVGEHLVQKNRSG